MKRKKPTNCEKDQQLSCYIDSPLTDLLLSAAAHALWLPALQSCLLSFTLGCTTHPGSSSLSILPAQYQWYQYLPPFSTFKLDKLNKIFIHNSFSMHQLGCVCNGRAESIKLGSGNTAPSSQQLLCGKHQQRQRGWMCTQTQQRQMQRIKRCQQL